MTPGTKNVNPREPLKRKIYGDPLHGVTTTHRDLCPSDPTQGTSLAHNLSETGCTQVTASCYY